MSARFCPYCPNNAEASRLSSNATTIWVAGLAATGLATSDPASDGRRANDLTSCAGQCRLPSLRAVQLAEQAVRSDVGDSHGRNLANQRCRGHDLHGLQVLRPTDQLTGNSARLFDENFKLSPDAAPVECALMMIDAILEPDQALGLHLVRDLIAAIGRGRPWTRRILERERSDEFHFLHDTQRVGEILLRFAWEADDEIRRKSNVGTGGPQPHDLLEVFGPGVATVHRVEHTVRTGLHRKMKLRHQHRQITVSGDKVRIDVARMAGRVTKPQHA